VSICTGVVREELFLLPPNSRARASQDTHNRCLHSHKQNTEYIKMRYGEHRITSQLRGGVRHLGVFQPFWKHICRSSKYRFSFWNQNYIHFPSISTFSLCLDKFSIILCYKLKVPTLPKGGTCYFAAGDSLRVLYPNYAALFRPAQGVSLSFTFPISS
jgi:hypothetical protein